MWPKALLLDLDNTLYEYEPANSAAKSAVIAEISTFYGRPRDEVEAAFAASRKRTHDVLHGTASSHNRFLYLQIMFEILRIGNYQHLNRLHDLFWSEYFAHMSLRPGVQDFFETCNLPTCIVTDFTAEKQFQKLEKLKILSRFPLLVSSEEVGCEKPEKAIFLAGLKKLGRESSEVCMIGDDFKKDISGANDCGIFAYWLTDSVVSNTTAKDFRVFHTFADLTAILNEK